MTLKQEADGFLRYLKRYGRGINNKKTASEYWHYLFPENDSAMFKDKIESFKSWINEIGLYLRNQGLIAGDNSGYHYIPTLKDGMAAMEKADQRFKTGLKNNARQRKAIAERFGGQIKL